MITHVWLGRAISFLKPDFSLCCSLLHGSHLLLPLLVLRILLLILFSSSEAEEWFLEGHEAPSTPAVARDSGLRPVLVMSKSLSKGKNCKLTFVEMRFCSDSPYIFLWYLLPFPQVLLPFKTKNRWSFRKGKQKTSTNHLFRWLQP